MPIVNIRQNLPVYYEDKGSGLPIVFIHPPGMGQVVFRYQNTLLSDQYRIITYDIRGQGQSGNNHDKLSIPLLAEDLMLLLDALGIERAIICGYSAGSSIALEFALSYLNRVEALILPGAYPEVSSLILEKEYKAGMKMVKENPVLLAKILAKSHRNNRKDEKILYEYMLKNNPESWYENYRESLHYKCTDQLHLINKPVLLIYGQLSAYLKGYRKLFFKHMENVKYETIPLSFHQLPFKKYKAFNQKVRNFMDSL
jgi:pimeloyl-ACP methyl ester carboxylesterase